MSKTAQDYLQTNKPHPVDEPVSIKWVKGPDDRYVDISADDRFDQLFAEWQADACSHERTGIVEWINGGNQLCFNWFCGDCGAKLSSNIPHALAREHGTVSATLDSLASRSKVYVDQRQTHLSKIQKAAAERVQPINRGEYDDYLRSHRWRELRARVLDRARGICEGCLDAPAEHVHHLTYEHRGHEFAFELRALCEPCHARLHGEVAV